MTRNEEILRRELEQMVTIFEGYNGYDDQIEAVLHAKQALKATEPPKYDGQRTCDKCGGRHPIGQRHKCGVKP